MERHLSNANRGLVSSLSFMAQWGWACLLACVVLLCNNIYTPWGAQRDHINALFGRLSPTHTPIAGQDSVGGWGDVSVFTWSREKQHWHTHTHTRTRTPAHTHTHTHVHWHTPAATLLLSLPSANQGVIARCTLACSIENAFISGSFKSIDRAEALSCFTICLGCDAWRNVYLRRCPFAPCRPIHGLIKAFILFPIGTVPSMLLVCPAKRTQLIPKPRCSVHWNELRSRFSSSFWSVWVELLKEQESTVFWSLSKMAVPVFVYTVLVLKSMYLGLSQVCNVLLIWMFKLLIYNYLVLL